MLDSISGSIGIARTTAGQEITDHNADTDTDGDGLVGIFADGLVRRLRAGDGLVTDIARDFPGAFERSGEPLAGFTDFFAGYVGGGGHQRVASVLLKDAGEAKHTLASILGDMRKATANGAVLGDEGAV